MSDAALWLLASAVAVSSISLLANAIAAIGTYRAVSRLRADVGLLIPRVQTTLENANLAIESTAREIHAVVELGREVLADLKTQIEQIDAARTDLAQQVRIHGQRLELVTEDILGRIQEVVSVFHGSVIRPVREVTGIVAGVRAAVQTFLLGRKATPVRGTHDEEMFI